MQMFIARKAAGVSVGTAMSLQSLQRLNAAIAESRKYHHLISELESRLALGKLKLRMGRTHDGHSTLAALIKEATAKGLLLVARQANDALGESLQARGETPAHSK
jgi:hypothetical protein